MAGTVRVNEAMRPDTTSSEKTLKNETYENQIVSHGRPDRRGNLVCPCRSSLRLFVRSAPASARRGDGSRCAGCCDCACCHRAVSGGDNSSLSGTGLCPGTGLLVGQRLQPRVGSRLLAIPSRACRVCPSAWLASLVTEVVVAGLLAIAGAGSPSLLCPVSVLFGFQVFGVGRNDGYGRVGTGSSSLPKCSGMPHGMFSATASMCSFAAVGDKNFA